MDGELNSWLAQGEGETLEFKRDPHDSGFREKFCRTVSAFANGTAGGALLIGIHDDGTVSGYRDSKGDAEKLSNWIADWLVSPKPDVEITTITRTEGDVIVVRVKPSPHPAWFAKKLWLRVGKTTREASLPDMRRIEERAQARSFDATPCLSAALEDIAEDIYTVYQREFVAPDVIAANGRDFLEKLSGQSFADIHSGKPTYGGLLICGKNPQRLLPLATVLFVRTASDSLTDRAAILDEREIKGDLPTQIRELESLLRVSIETWHEQEGLRQERVTSYPWDSLRELVVNALLHRDYSLPDSVRIYWFRDRVEIKSPGGLMPPATAARFPRVTAYRNPIIATAFRNLGFIERFGNGVDRAISALTHNGNPPPRFDLDFSDHVRVTVTARRKV
jgi:ATP-dependent DNA helicase RecG